MGLKKQTLDNFWISLGNFLLSPIFRSICMFFSLLSNLLNSRVHAYACALVGVMEALIQ